MRYPFSLLLALTLFACKSGVYRAPSSSMAETIREGEPFYVKATDKFERDDIVVFDVYAADYSAPPDENGAFVKHWERRFCRLVAISGDTLEVRNDTVLLNRKAIPFPPGGKLIYDVYTARPLDDKELTGAEEYMPGAPAGDPEQSFLYKLSLSRDQRTALQKNPAVRRIDHAPDPKIPVRDTQYATPASDQAWNTSHYGPLRIPLPGETVEVTADNFKLYQNIPGVQPGPFKISEPLYFVMGDNRHFSQDSRFIGFISRSRMYGIVK